MNNSAISTALLAGALFTQCCPATAAEMQPAASQNTFRVTLGATRVIYPEGAAGAQLSVSNPQGRPMLVQSSVTGEDHKTPAPFLVTPPLFRLEANQQSRLRIIRTGGSLPQTRESLYWLCVKALPPSGDASGHAVGVSVTVNMAVSMCDKLIFRPDGLKGSPEDSAGALTWARTDQGLRVSNPTPFYMNLKAVSLGGKEVGHLTYVPPRGNVTLPLPAGADGAVKWSVINDQGGESRRFEAAAD